jgi:hypothetical protein
MVFVTVGSGAKVTEGRSAEVAKVAGSDSEDFFSSHVPMEEMELEDKVPIGKESSCFADWSDMTEDDKDIVNCVRCEFELAKSNFRFPKKFKNRKLQKSETR